MTPMAPLPFASGRAFRVRSQLVRSVIGIPTAGVISLYLSGLLELSRAQWIWLGWYVLGFGLVYGILVQRLLLRLDGPIRAAIDAEAAGQPSRDLLRAGFAAAMRFPLRGFQYTAGTWLTAGLLLPALMQARFRDLPLETLGALLTSSLMGGVIASVFTFFNDKRIVAPLRDRWAAQLRDPLERQALVTRVTIAAKLRSSVTAIVLVSVILAVLLSDALARRPIEAYATRIQQGYLAGMAERIDGPGDRMLPLAREELVQLGIGADLLVVDAVEGRVADGPADALAPSELAWIRSHRFTESTSLGLQSDRAFAWRALDGDDRHVLVAVTSRRALTGDLTRAQLLFALLALSAAGLGLATAQYLARDVGDTTERLRRLAERIAGGDLTEAEPVESEDELGVLAHAFERMSASLRATVGRVAEAAAGVEAAAAAIAQAGGSVRDGAGDQSRALASARESVGAIDREVAGITDFAQSLSGHVEEAGSSVLELGAAGEELNHTASSLSDQVEDVGASLEQLIRSVRQIASNTEELGGAASDTSSSMAEIAASMRDVDAHAAETARLSERVVAAAERGSERVAQTVEGMEAIRRTSEAVEAVIRGLGGRVQEIGAILDVIDDVADETNLLALNAAIIAAQAGDQGRAFSVVADEIGELAERVLSSTKEISGLIRAVQAETANAAGAIESGSASVRQGVALAAEAGRSLDDITATARASGDRIAEIVHAVREQSRAAAHVAALMERVSGGVAEIREAGREQDRVNQGVLRHTHTMRDVAQQVHRTTEEQARGATRIRDSMERVRDAVDQIHGSLRQQSDACRRAVAFLEQIHARTRSSEEAAARMSEATLALRGQAEALRQDVRRFRI